MQNEEELQERYHQLRDDYQDFQIIIFKIGFCHHCHRREIVYECFRDFKFTSCKKRYCEDCLERYYRVNINKVMKRDSSWYCPYKSGKCKCSTCIYRDQNNETEEQIYQNDIIPFLLQTPVYEGEPRAHQEYNEELAKECLQVLKVKPERESVWQETLYENSVNQKSTIYIM